MCKGAVVHSSFSFDPKNPGRYWGRTSTIHSESSTRGYERK